MWNLDNIEFLFLFLFLFSLFSADSIGIFSVTAPGEFVVVVVVVVVGRVTA